MKLFFLMVLLAAPVGWAAPGDPASPEPTPEKVQAIADMIPANSHVPGLGRVFTPRLGRARIDALKKLHLAEKPTWNKTGHNLFRLATLPVNIDSPEFYAAILDELIRDSKIEKETLFLGEMRKVLGTELLFMYRAFEEALANKAELNIAEASSGDSETISLYRELKGKTPRPGEQLAPRGFAHLRLFAEFFSWLGENDTRRPRSLWSYCVSFDQFLNSRKHLVGFMVHVQNYHPNWNRTGFVKTLLKEYGLSRAQLCAVGFFAAGAIAMGTVAFWGDLGGANIPNKGDTKKKAEEAPKQDAPNAASEETLDKFYDKLADDLVKSKK